MLGRLTLSDIPYNNPIIAGAFGFMILCVLALLVLVTVLHRWKWLWKEWLTTTDHKKIGIMYMIVAAVMGLRGFADGVLMRSQQALAFAPGGGYLPPEHFDQIFSGHGVIMILFMAMPLLIGLINVVVPQQIGARDVAFPFLNSVSLWLFVVGVVLANVSLGIGSFAQTGWSAYPPLSEANFSPGVGVDYYIWCIQLAGLGTLFTGVNFVTTILKMRAPGMKLMNMPIFTWTVLCTMILVIGAFPILTVALALLTLDRYLGFHFFTAAMGGLPNMWVNLFWAWGHPEVYILILPAFGIHAEVAATFSRKRMFGYSSVIWAAIAIMVLSYMVWLHHFFTMGAGADVNAVFGISTMCIAIPTGVKIYNWVFTIFRGKLHLTAPILWTLGFVVTFTIGGMTGVMLALPPADFVLHNSEFLIAHFHNVIVGGTVFGIMGGLIYWFPKMFGFTLNDRIGKAAGAVFLAAFYVTFVPLYILGFMGMTRRLNYTVNTAWRPLLWISAFGVVLFALSILIIVIQIVLGFVQRKKNADLSGDPWDGRTLEWSLPSPPPTYNFARIPTVTGRDAFWEAKHGAEAAGGNPKGGPAGNAPGVPPLNPADPPRGASAGPFEPITVPRNTPAGILVGAFSLIFGFGMIWYIWWMAILGLAGVVVTFVVRNSRRKTHVVLSSDEVARLEALHRGAPTFPANPEAAP